TKNRAPTLLAGMMLSPSVLIGRPSFSPVMTNPPPSQPAEAAALTRGTNGGRASGGNASRTAPTLLSPCAMTCMGRHLLCSERCFFLLAGCEPQETYPYCVKCVRGVRVRKNWSSPKRSTDEKLRGRPGDVRNHRRRGDITDRDITEQSNAQAQSAI